MAEKTRGQQFTWVDVGDWVEQGLIAPDQAQAIRQYIEVRSAAAERPKAGPEQPRGLNLVTIAYYFGGFMILLAYTVFMGLQWDSFSYTGQATILLFTIGVLWVTGYLVRRGGYQTAAGLLIFAGTGIVPLLVFSLLKAMGIWPDPQPYPQSETYQQNLELASMFVFGVSLFVALLVLLRIRFPLLVLLVALWSWWLVMTFVGWIFRKPSWSWDSEVLFAASLLGLAMIVVGIVLQSRERQRYSLWLYIVGHLIVLTHLSPLWLGKGAALGLCYLTIYLSFVVASVWLQQRVFLVFGAIGCYIYIAYLAFDVFSGSLGFVFALAAVGFLIILTTVGYQKYAQSWLASQFAPHHQLRRLDA